jgi:hypothetical protein
VPRPCFRPRAESLEDRLAPATFTVTTTSNGGAGSLRAAIVAANATPAEDDVIEFDIGTGVQKINLLKPLPQITDTLTIDGTTQGGFTTKPLIVLNGARAGGSGLVVAATADNSVIRGLVIHRFAGHGIVLRSDGNTVDTCFIGTNPAGSGAPGNGGNGIAVLQDSANNTIGGAGDAKNLISGNRGHGVLLQGSGVTGNDVRGNFIGTNLEAPFVALPNGLDGISIARGADANTVGTTDLAFVTFVAGNNRHGINISGAGTDGNTVLHTTVGSNLGSGVRIGEGAKNNVIGGPGVDEFNVISANFGNGVAVTGAGTSGNLVRGNYIGTDQDGLLEAGNGRNGVAITAGASNNAVGGTAPDEGNLISSNLRNGVNVAGAGTSNNLVAGNLIGTEITGTANQRVDPDPLVGLQVFANGGSGVVIAAGATNNTVGGTTADALNLISGNVRHGVVLAGAGTVNNRVIGNAIGTNLAGTAAVANGRHGVQVAAGAKQNAIGGTAAGEGNTISGNTRAGVVVLAGQTVIRGNRIGTNAAGTAAVANGSHGVIVTNRVSNTLIGGTAPGAGNTIAFNGGAGVVIGRDPALGFTIPAGAGNAINGNSIHSNALLGIDIRANTGVTANDPTDADGGPNRRQNFPVITSAVNVAGIVTVNFTLNSTPNTTFRIEFFANTAADPSGNGEGQVFLGFVDVTTDAAGAGAGIGVFPLVLPGATHITATATHLDRNDTSEFSAAVAIT